MINEISDHRLQSYFKKYVNDNCTVAEKVILKSLLSCGVKILKPNNFEPAVFLLANDRDAKFWGHTTCKNAWACPVCAAKMMSKYASRIAVALDALEQQGKKAFMMTLTIPHTSGMTCEESTEIIYQVWKDFIVHGNKIQNVKYYANKDNKFKHNQQKEMKISDKKLQDPFATFCGQLGCTQRVRVGEFTYGEHGWHPHFHCLFWVDADKFEQVKDWEEKLCDRWLELAKRKTLNYWNKIFPDKKDDNKKRLEIMYNKLNSGSKALYISKDKNNNVIVQKSSNYICGWAADREVTGNVRNKATKEGHFTPYQLLEKGANGDDHAMRLYIEYAVATKKYKHCRINFSKGLKKIIDQYMQTEKYHEFLKKKRMQEKENSKWTVICWFNIEQWNQLLELNKHFPILSNILFLAKHGETYIKKRQLLQDYLKIYNIDILNQCEHPLEMLIEDVMNDTNTAVA